MFCTRDGDDKKTGISVFAGRGLSWHACAGTVVYTDNRHPPVVQALN
ncbi:hypothetical protein [Photorhabdus akhurstii]|nr:hypothetical protein [Photorhabdus akhurstii]